MSLVDCRLQDSLCARRRLLSAAMKPLLSLIWSLWFLLLLGAGSLLLLVHLQDLSEAVQQQTSGVNVLVAPRWPVEEEVERVSAAERGFGAAVMSQANSGLVFEVESKLPITKRHRKLLLKHNMVSSSAPSVGEEEQLRLVRLQEFRRRLLREACAKYHPGVIKRPVSVRQVSRVFVEDQSRLLYCEVPKAGCSNWKRVLMVLGGSAISTRDIAHDVAHYANHLRRLESYDRAGITERLHSYTKVLFVREPFERLVSAFRDKFESPNSYYHPVFGRPIISRYRANATRTALHTGAGVTFREFVQYLLDVHRPVGMDIHWEPVSQLCHPCLLRYDFIGKFESLEDEANFLLRSVGAPRNLTFPDFKDRNPLAERTSSRITQKYFSQLNATERQKAFDFYYMDYLMFNYPKPFKDLH
ncbi:carbohydrate sulfotransferase 8-like isoform X2 [Echeneis naucrates]|uniref:carbohydrate sulfotransferase 8-like isoform X2 n=1 Tax=Echeneis naucrates TaxID=173247 RepID=UPI001113BD31|nr:carbohydrate sulfotransferase 8-like isoform X2 [Echeneis naucrates]